MPPAHADPVFVVGFYRSGTSLLHALLNRHPALALMYECDILKLWPVVRVSGGQRDWAERLQFWNSALSRHRLAAAAFAGGPRDRRACALALYRAYAAEKGAALCGEKSPYYHDRLPQLAADFPQSKIVVLWRSPLETLRSVRRAGKTERFFAREDFAMRLVVGMKKLARDTARLRAAGHAVHEVQYRDLVSRQRETLTGICEFLGLPFDECLLDLAGADTSVLPTGEHHSGVREGVRPSPARDEVLHERERAYIERECETLPGAPWNTAAPGGTLPPPDWAERQQSNRLALWENFIRVIYACLPLPVLAAWRGRQERRFSSASR